MDKRIKVGLGYVGNVEEVRKESSYTVYLGLIPLKTIAGDSHSISNSVMQLVKNSKDTDIEFGLFRLDEGKGYGKHKRKKVSESFDIIYILNDDLENIDLSFIAQIEDKVKFYDRDDYVDNDGFGVKNNSNRAIAKELYSQIKYDKSFEVKEIEYAYYCDMYQFKGIDDIKIHMVCDYHSFVKLDKLKNNFGYLVSDDKSELINKIISRKKEEVEVNKKRLDYLRKNLINYEERAAKFEKETEALEEELKKHL